MEGAAPLVLVEKELELLLGASSKEVLARVLQDAFECRLQGGWTRDRRRRVSQELGLADDAAAQALFAALCRLLALALAVGEQDTGALLEAAFSETFHRKLRQRLVSALQAALPGWREASVLSQVSLPRLLTIDCTVAVTAASSCAGGAGEAALLLLQVEGEQRQASSVPAPRTIAVLLDRDALAAAVQSGQVLRSRLQALAGQQ